MPVTYGEQHQRRRESWSSFRNQYIIQFVEQQKFIVRLQFRLLLSSINPVFWWVVFERKKSGRRWLLIIWIGKRKLRGKSGRNINVDQTPCFSFLPKLGRTLWESLFLKCTKRKLGSIYKSNHPHSQSAWKTWQEYNSSMFSMLNFAFLLFILILKSVFSFLIITFQPRKHSYVLCLIFFFSLWLIFFLFWWRVDKKYYVPW